MRRLVVAAAVFGLVGAGAAPALAQDETAASGEETAAQEPATLEDVVFAELTAEDTPAEAPAEEAAAETPAEGDAASGDASAAQSTADASGDGGGEAAPEAAQEAAPVQQGVPAEAILPVPDPVQPVYMTPDQLIAGEFPGAAEAAPVEAAAAPEAAAETAAAPEESGGRHGGGGSTEALIGDVVDGATGAGAPPEDGVVVDGGTIDNSTSVDADTAGGAGVADGSGGDGNTAVAVAEDNGRVGNDGNTRGGRQGRPNLAGIARGGGSRGADIGLADRAIAAVGNGGLANANANGGTIMIGPIISGDNKGNTILVGSDGGCIDGPVYIDGGDVDNSLNINLDASGGIAIADASGGSNNVGMAGGGGDAGALGSVGNGGDARANANGGSIMMGPIISGGNEGNTIEVAGGPCGDAAAPAPVPEAGKPGRPGKPGGGAIVVPSQKGKAPKITAVPSTGAGAATSLIPGLLAIGGSVAAGALGIRRRRV